MSDGSTIEWLQRPGTKPASWNPIIAWRDVPQEGGGSIRLRGWHCEHVHEGCTGCYAEDMNETGRYMGTKLPYKPGHRKDVTIDLHEPTLLQPLKWRQPRTIFVCSMTDLYGSWVKQEWLDKIKAVQALTPQHTYIELTKRPERMRAYATDETRGNGERDASSPSMGSRDRIILQAAELYREGYPANKVTFPLPNAWGLVSCSTQEDADKFVPQILKTPLAVRGVSYEPALGSIDFTRICLLAQKPGSIRAGIHLNALKGRYCESGVTYTGDWDIRGPAPAAGTPALKLDWIIAGGESGKNARPMHPQWARDIRDQCAAAGVPFFFKQWGEYCPQFDECGGQHPAATAHTQHHVFMRTEHFGTSMVRVGKKAAGRLLDGREHSEFPVTDGSRLQPALASQDSSGRGSERMSEQPKRVRRSRAKGARLPENTVCVDRSTKWGNPFEVGKHGTRVECVQLYKTLLAGYICISSDIQPNLLMAYRAMVVSDRHQLKGKNLACWCSLDGPCHADALLEVAALPFSAPVGEIKEVAA